MFKKRNSSGRGFGFKPDAELVRVSNAAGQEMSRLIDYIEREFKTDRIRATFVAGVLIGSLEEMIKLNNGQNSVKEIIKEYDNNHD